MRALTVRPPWGSAIARWGKWLENRDRLIPYDSMLGERFAVHQGKRWTAEEASHALTLRIRIPFAEVQSIPLTHDGYPQGVVATTRLLGYIDARPTDEQVNKGHAVRMININRPTHTRMVRVVGFTDRRKAHDVAHRASVDMWAIGPILWLLAETVALDHVIACPGRQGIFNLPKPIEAQIPRNAL